MDELAAIAFFWRSPRQSRPDLITADERLANALAARFPVKWLGAFIH